jgi:hypothetical protein
MKGIAFTNNPIIKKFPLPLQMKKSSKELGTCPISAENLKKQIAGLLTDF